MNSAEQTVTWLITLGVLESPKKSISDPEAFLQSSLRDGVVLCKLLDRLRPGSVEKVIPEPRSDGECQENIGEFLKGCGAFRVEVFEVNDLLQGLNFTKVLNSLVALNKATEVIGVGEDSGCSRHSSLRIKSFDCLHTAPHTHSSKQPHNQYRSLDMSEGIGQQLLVKARFAFQPTNEDELSFSKGDVISVGRQEDGGWWEGTFNGKTGWFPSNYVREVKGCEKPISPKSGTLKSPLKALDTTAISKTYYNVVLQNILETETEFSTELQTLLTSYLRSLHTTDRWTSADISTIQGNLEEISTFQQILVQSLEERLKLPENQQRVGAFFLSLIPQMSSLYVAYCSNHPSAVSLLTQHSAELGEFMESQGASSPGILTLTTGLSKPFTRLDRYPALLLELDRHMEDHHPDQPDIQKCMAAFKNLAAQCQRVRKRRELELQILTDAVVGWEGDDITTLGPVLHMTQASVQSQSQENGERYLLLFPHVLLMLSTSPRMSGFIYQGKLSLAGLSVSRLDDNDNLENTFQITGAQCEPLQVVCNGPQDFQEWMEHLHHLTKPDPALTKPPLTVTMPTLRSPPPAVTTPILRSPPPAVTTPILRTPPPVVTTPTLRTLPAPCHTMPAQPLTPPRHSDGRTVSGGSVYHTLPHLSSCQGTPHASLAWPPLEPPAPPKPWSLSCLRPAPPLHPAGAPGYKEDLSKSPKSMKKLLPKRKPERKPSEEDFITRKSTAALEEDAQILKVIEAYCTSAKTRQTLNSTWQGTDLMHNHVIDADRDSVVAPGNPGREPPCSDQSEDSEYDSVWNAHSHRTASVSRSRKESGVHLLFPEEERIIVEETRSNGQTVMEEKSLVDTVYGLRDEVQELKQDNKRMRRSLEEEQRARKDLEKMVRRVLKNMNDPTWDETNL